MLALQSGLKRLKLESCIRDKGWKPRQGKGFRGYNIHLRVINPAATPSSVGKISAPCVPRKSRKIRGVLAFSAISAKEIRVSIGGHDMRNFLHLARTPLLWDSASAPLSLARRVSRHVFFTHSHPHCTVRAAHGQPAAEQRFGRTNPGIRVVRCSRCRHR